MSYMSPGWLLTPGGSGSGSPGAPGEDGKSAYELAVEEGFSGTLEEWLESLDGSPFYQQNTTPPTAVFGARWFCPLDGVIYTLIQDGTVLVWAEL